MISWVGIGGQALSSISSNYFEDLKRPEMRERGKERVKQVTKRGRGGEGGGWGASGLSE